MIQRGLLERIGTKLLDIDQRLALLEAVEQASGGGGGATAFTGLTDTPANYTGAAGQLVRVNATPDGLEFVAMSSVTHASQHQHGGADEVATATPGNNAIPKAEADGKLAAGWIDPADIDHTAITNIGSNSHAQIDTHIADTANPHAVTKAQVGLGNVSNNGQYYPGGPQVAIADGGTGAGNAADARTNLGLGSIATAAATAYLLLAGQAGGQSAYGGTGSGDDLTLESTSDATKGFLVLQPNDGNVGIGESSPTYKLHVTGIDGALLRLERTDAVIETGTIGIYSNPGGLTSFAGLYLGSSSDLGLSATDDLHLGAGAAQAAILTAGGDLGVGTTAPFNSRIEAYEDVAGGLRISINNPNAAGSSILQFFEGTNYQGRVYYTNADDYLTIQNDQGSGIIKLLGPSAAVPLVGIGAATPTHNLHVEDPAGGTTTIKVSDGSNVAYLQVGVANAGARLILDNNDANQDRWDITTGITNGRLTFVNDDNSLNAVEIASNGLLMPHYGMRVADTTATSDDQYEVNFFGDGTNAQPGNYYSKVKIFGGGSQTRHLELYQVDSSDAYIDSTFADMHIRVASGQQLLLQDTGGTVRARLNSTGLGVGTVTPQGKIHAEQNGGQFVFRTLTSVNGTPQNIITGSWVAFVGVVSIKDSSGNGGSKAVAFQTGSDTVTIDGSNHVTLSISSGNVQVVRSAGTRTYTVTVAGVVA